MRNLQPSPVPSLVIVVIGSRAQQPLSRPGHPPPSPQNPTHAPPQVLKSATIQFVNDWTLGDYVYFKPKVDSATGVLVTGEYEPEMGRLRLSNKASGKTYEAALRTIGYRASGTYYNVALQQVRKGGEEGAGGGGGGGGGGLGGVKAKECSAPSPSSSPLTLPPRSSPRP